MALPRFAVQAARCLVLMFITGALFAQQPPSPSPNAPSDAVLKQVMAREFGATFELLPFPSLFFDLDGDGTEDAVIVATSKEPLLDADERHYKVVDPYDDYFGLGDPKITVGFTPTQLGPPRHLLVIHNWRAAAPGAKFVIINLPFEKLSPSRTQRKKKSIPALSAEENGGLISKVFWDGKKYRWESSYMAQ